MQKKEITLEEIIKDMKKIYEEHGSCTTNLYNKYGKISVPSIRKKLNLNFNDLLKMANLPINLQIYKKEDVVQDVLKIYNQFGYINRELYIANGKYSRKPIDRIFGSWNKMLLELNLPINCFINISEEDLLNNLKEVYSKFGYICAELNRHHGKYSNEVYWRRFGSFNNALEKAHLPTNSTGTSIIADIVIDLISEILQETPVKEKKFPWLRYKKPLKIDAYFEKNNLAVEYNGKQHYEVVNHFENDRNSFKKIQIRDKTKYKLLQEHGIKLLIIKYDEPISKEYLLSRIKEIL